MRSDGLRPGWKPWFPRLRRARRHRPTAPIRPRWQDRGTVTEPRPPKIPESVLVVIYTDAREVLLIERADHAGFWQSVTGSKDLVDEPLRDTAMREVAEETGIVIGSPAVPASALHDWN